VKDSPQARGMLHAVRHLVEVRDDADAGAPSGGKLAGGQSS
jgi:hypothetical protein